MKLSRKSIKEIAENLDCGMVCYINKKTLEIKSIIDPDDVYSEEEFWREDLDYIENNWESYVKVEKMSSKEAFQIMEDFANLVSNKDIRNKLIYALSRSKPFRNFKYEVDYNEDIRQQWFKFKAFKYEEWVEYYLNELNDDDEGIRDLSKSEPKVIGFFNDDGSEYNPDLFPLPNLCLSCKKKGDPNEEIVCNLTRMDQLGETEFKCFAYKKDSQ